MNEQEIFEHLFSIAIQSDDTGGVVTSCLVRDKEIIADAFSTNDGVHAEYALLQKLKDDKVSIDKDCQKNPMGAGQSSSFFRRYKIARISSYNPQLLTFLNNTVNLYSDSFTERLRR